MAGPRKQQSSPGAGRAPGARGNAAPGTRSTGGRSAGAKPAPGKAGPARSGAAKSAAGPARSGPAAGKSRSGPAAGKVRPGPAAAGKAGRAPARSVAPTRGDAAPAGRGAPKGGAPKGGAPKTGGPRSRAPRRAPGPVVRSADRGLDGTQVEGRHAVRELLLAGTRRVREVLIAEAMDPAEILEDIVELAQDLKVPVREISKRRLDAESRTEASQGVVAHADPLPEYSLEELAGSVRSARSNPGAGTTGAPFLVAVDGVTDPGNLGAIIRTAECAGVTGILLPRHRAVHVTPTVTKTAAGAVEHVPMALVGGLPTAIEEMKAHGVWVIGLDAGGEKSLHEVALGDEPVCLVLGAEGEGLSRLVRQRCDQIVSIPLIGSLSSLNVSTAAALAMYEVVRRRAQG